MLKTLATRCSAHAAFGLHLSRHVPTGESTSPLVRVILGQNRRSPYFVRRFFCSDSIDGSDPAESAGLEGKRVETGEEAVDSKSSSAIVPTVVRPEDCLTVIALPLPHRPLFPGFYMPIYVKDPKLLAALVENRKRQAPYTGAFLLKDEEVTEGSDADKNIYDLKGKELFNRLHEVGTLAQITSIQGDQVVLIGHRRLRITEMVSEDPLTVKVDHLKEKPYDKDDDILKATSFEVISTLRDVLKTSPLWRDHAQTYTQHIGDFTYPRVADFGAAISGANKLQCQEVLEELDVHKRLKLTLELVKKEMEISKIQESIAKAIEEKISGEQRRYLLNEQLKAIKKELGLETDDKTALTAKFRERLDPKKDKIPPHILQVIEEEQTKLNLLEASSSEFNVTRNYLDWLTALPWGEYSDENFDVIRAQTILDEDHYGLTDVKERILEFIAVGKLRGISQGKIICLSGPPGVGKTSIGRSIARALNRKFYRFSVGGLSDVAEIKGHRRTYIGAMPGKMVQCLKSVGTANPLVLIDEIDKLGRGHSGDPASAMLELLDPEQNANFLDHYLDVTIDLSKVLFVCTANVVEMIPNPLLDRMEVISIAGYITDEKMHIARDYLEKTTREACGIKPEQVEVTDSALLALIENYCREAGVRNLQKQIEKIYRKIALQLVRQGHTGVKLDEDKSESGSISTESVVETVDMEKSGNAVEAETVDPPAQADEDTLDTEKNQDSEAAKKVEKVLVDSSNLVDFVGKPVFQAERIYDQTPVGVVMGLAWTAMGGSTLYIETTQVEQGDGKGALNVTGQLGDVMKESAQIAYTVARAILLEKDPENHFFANTKLHLHVPAGATPKDGPSAGCTMITSLLSLAMNRTVKKDLAMTGEVTLTRKILPIGGVKEKTIAARRSEVKTIVFPSANRRDFDELAPNVKEDLEWRKLMSKLEILSEELNEPNLWDDPAHAGKISREHASIMSKIKAVNTFEQELFEHIDMIKLAHEENDTELESESLNALLRLRSDIKEKELEALLAEEHDSCSCFIEVQAGAGGTESMDWASMVMQMYKKWAEGLGFGVTVVDEMPGDVAGIKRATIKVDGEYAYGYAKAEVGAHRLVRISPFDSNKRRHTSFASVAVIPILGVEFSHFQIDESDLRIERYRSGGSGGQHANTTDSAVRITHIPTGVTASCQNERSQHQNKASAMAVLQSRLDQLEMERQAKINAEHTQSLTDINFGSQIRSYVLHPYRMVKDHRTDYEVSDPDSVLEGDLDGFIFSFLSASMDKNED